MPEPRKVLGLVVLAASVVLTWYLLATGTRGAEIAGVLSLEAAILAGVVGLLVRAREPGQAELLEASRRLAVQVRRQTAGTLQRLLADTGVPEPADLQYRRADRQSAAAVEQDDWSRRLVRWRSDGGLDNGALSDIGAYYGTLRRGRLLILGGPGAGKTVLALTLLLDRLDLFMATACAGQPSRVPLLLSLPSWPTLDGDPDDQLVSSHLDRWITRQVALTGRLRRPVAAALVTGGWVLPILDGLDEMDGHDRADAQPAGDPRRDSDRRPLPRRASLVLRALNQDPGTGLRPVVLTCRQNRYRRLLDSPAPPGASRALADATTVVVRPLSTARIIGYLARRFPGVERDTVEERWQPVADHLAADSAGALAGTLETPWRLFLAMTAYHSPGSHPSELVAAARTRPADLSEDLLHRLVPALTEQYPRARRTGGYYQPDQVVRALTVLARQLETQRERGGSGTDLHLSQVWQAAGQRSPRLLHGVLAALPGLLLTPVDLAVDLIAKHDRTFSAADIAFDYSQYFVAGILAPSLWAYFRPSSMHRMNLRSLRRPGRTGLRTLGFWLCVGTVVGLVVGAVGGLGPEIGGRSVGVGPWLAGGVAVGVAAGLAHGLGQVAARSPDALDRPSRLLREDRGHGLVVGLGVGLVGGFSFGIAYGIGVGIGFVDNLAFGEGLGLLSGLAGGLAYGLTYGTIYGLALSLTTPGWTRFDLAGLVLARRGAIPGSLRGFIDWAYSAGLLRLSGTALQFRHLELQRWIEHQE